ncbi:MAG: SLC13 family permease [Gammaproteobacteria bacterium]|nr:SLC13 family permease [Gammaproteobacteria bacterium]
MLIITSIILFLVFAALIFWEKSPDIILWSGVMVLLIIPYKIEDAWLFGVLKTELILNNFANEGVLTIAAFFIIAAGLRETGFLQIISQNFLKYPKSLFSAQNRIIWPTALTSAFMNNTPLVAMLLPAIDDWARRNGLSVSKLLIPLSYASILGGACTLIGTSSNLIVNGWLINELGQSGLGLFEISMVGIPVAVFGLLYILIAGKWLLADRTPVIDQDDDSRRYTVEMLVEDDGILVGKSIEQAGLRGLNGLYLIEIDRDGEILPAVSSEIILHGNDRLVFAGVIDSVVDLQNFRGLQPATNQIFKLTEPRRRRHLIEAVVSHKCPLVGKSIREGKFRTNYNAAVIAVARSGERIDKKIGDIVLKIGDVLLLEARSNFLEQQKNRPDFYLVSRASQSTLVEHKLAYLSLGLLGLMVMTVALGFVSILTGALITAVLMILTGCCNPGDARRAIDLETILVIVAALCLGNAIEISGLANSLANHMINIFGNSPALMLSAIFITTMVLGNLITSKASAVLMLPIVLAITNSMNISIMPFIIAVMLASATALATPIGYPTNLMIYGVGGYKFKDYLVMGVPLSIGIWVIASILIPIIWPFY